MKETNIGQDNMAKLNQWLLLDLSLKTSIDGVTQPIQVDSVILKIILNKYMLKKLIWYHSMKKIGYLTKHVYSDLSNYF